MAATPDVLVTGATGFIGSTLTRQLVEDGAHVRIFRRETSSLEQLGDVATRVDHAIGDITGARGLYDAMEGIDRVYHLAAVVSFAPGDQDLLRRTNVAGTANVVNAALEAGVDRLVHTSSMAAFGRSTDGPIDETTEWHGGTRRSAYARSKYRAELEIRRAMAEGLDAVIVNPSLVFGIGTQEANTRRIVDAVRNGWLLAVPPGTTNVVDVRDVAVGHRTAMATGENGRRYFLGGDNLSWKQIAHTLAHAFGVEPPRFTVPRSLMTVGGVVGEMTGRIMQSRPFLTRATARTATHSYSYDNSRARSELGCTFRPFSDTARWIAEGVK